MNTDLIKSVVEKQMNTKVSKIRAVGKGASGSVYLVKITTEPYEIAVKTSKFYDAICKEKDMLDFLSPKVSYKVPKTYFIYRENDTVYLGMDYIKGMSGKSKYLAFVPSRKRLRNSIIDALVNAQSVHNDKFGKYDNPVYDTWAEYYKDYFVDIYAFTKEKLKKNEILNETLSQVR